MKNRIKLLIWSLSFVLITIQLNGQEIKITGKIIDQKTKEPIPGTYIIINGLPVSFTDENGVFVMNDQKNDIVDVTFSHLAYKSKTISSKKIKSDTIRIELVENLFGLDEVIVTQEKIKSLVKKIHKHFNEIYRPNCYWAQSHYQQKILQSGITKGYLEIAGYSFMPVPDRYVAKGQPIVVPLELRRTKEDNMISRYFNGSHHIFHQAGPTLLDKGEFAFFERTHPLGKFNFGDYKFCIDTTEIDADNQLVLNYKQNKEVIPVVGWPIFGSSGKIWIDRNTFDIVRISGELNQGNSLFTRIEIDYLKIDKLIYPKIVKISTIFNRNNGAKLQEKYLVVSEHTFLHINTKKRPNYRMSSSKVEYLLPTIITDYEYHSSFWKNNFPLQGEWKNCVDQICDGNSEEEFFLGAKEEIFLKGCWHYGQGKRI